MMPVMNQRAIERAEKRARELDARRADYEPEAITVWVEAADEAKGFKKPASLRLTPVVKKPTRVKRYEFTDAQMQIALRSLNARGAV